MKDFNKIFTHKFNHLLFADDLILISEKPSGLQHCLNALLEVYCEEWGLSSLILKSDIHISDPYVIIGEIIES
jgi:hypothetical protein